MAREQVHIAWTQGKLTALKNQLAQAKESGATSIWFQDCGVSHEILVAYGEYLVDYLETEFAAAQAASH